MFYGLSLDDKFEFKSAHLSCILGEISNQSYLNFIFELFFSFY